MMKTNTETNQPQTMPTLEFPCKRIMSEGDSSEQFFIIQHSIGNNFQKPDMNITKRLFYRSGIFAVALLIANLFFAQTGFSQTVITNPTSPWTVPAGVTSVKVEVWGGGGAGGGTAAAAGTNIGSGGGGGAYNVATFTVSPGQSYVITVGAGGTGGSNANGNPGTLSQVSGIGGTVTANPGLGGARNGGAKGTGGTGFSSGGDGGTATSNGAGGGGGAGNASPANTGDGGDGTNTAAGAAGAGSPNSAPYVGGVGAASQNTNNTNGNAGVTPGGGGGGSKTNFSASGKSGGAGGAGQVVITYTVCINPAAPSGATNGATCGPGTVALSVSAPGAGLTIDWYAAASGGSALLLGNASFTTPSISTTTTYYAETRNIAGGCVSVTRTPVVATVRALPITSVTGQSDVKCFAGNDGTITISATPGGVPYFYSVNNGTTWTATSSIPPFTYSGLVANTAYRIKVKDNNGCISK